MLLRWEEHGGAVSGLRGGESRSAEALIAQQITGARPGLEQAFGDLALVHCGGHAGPGAHDPAAH